MNWKLAAASLLGILSATAQTVPVPKATLVPATPDSHPLGAASRTLQPPDLAKLGYVEEEFILGGKANVYSWSADGSIRSIASGPYADRILIRHPSNPARFSGTVVVEIMNSARKFDWSMMGGYLQDYMMERGDAWVGVTMPNAFQGLEKFNPARYASLSFANPAPNAPCEAAPKGGALPIEEGLRFDVLSQVAAALKSGAPGEPMTGYRVEAIYMTTQATDIETYINAIQPHAVLASGKPPYDGFLVKNPTGPAKINQCATASPKGDARTIIKDVNVPVVAVLAQGEVVATLPYRRPDADGPNGRYRLYEIPGAAHIDKFAYSTLPVFADQIAAAGTALGSPEWPFAAPCDPPIPLSTHPLLKYSYDAALMNLDQWVRKGIAPPHEERMLVTDGPMPALVLDEFGHAKGGVRNPWVDVPTATYTTTTPGPGTCAELGHVLPFTAERIKGLYPKSQDYAKKVTADVDALVKARWFTESDGKKMKADLVAAFGK